MGPNLMTTVLIRREETQTYTGRSPHEDGGGDWGDADPARGHQGRWHHQKLEKLGKLLPQSLPREHGTVDTWILDL